MGHAPGVFTAGDEGAAGRVLAIDVQPAMHAFYSEKGIPDNVSPVTAVADALPLADGSVDAAFSTMTYHEFATADALAELGRVLAPGGRLVAADWSGDGAGDAGPPVAERYTPAEVRDQLSEAGLTLERLEERPETFLFVATVPGV